MAIPLEDFDADIEVAHVNNVLRLELIEIMQRRDLKMADLARMFGVNRSYVTQVMQGKSSNDVLIRWLRWLGYGVTIEVKEY